MQLFDFSITKGIKEAGKCCSEQSVYDARRVAEMLNIPHYVINLEDEFKEKVIAPFISDYCKGKTPSPCILCNYYIKFDALLKKALLLGVDKLATGHYAKLIFEPNTNRWVLKKSVDLSKDQSYFLFNLTQYQLSKASFPLGDFTKKEIRKIAKSLHFPIANKPESQELCFIPNNDYRNFIKESSLTLFNEGNFISTDGKILGKHKGIQNYTIGQRRQLGIAIGKPLYVIKIDPLTNTITLGGKNDLYSSKLIAENMNWIAIDKPQQPFKAFARIRYKHEESPATIIPIDDSTVQITFDEAQRAITPGQAVVIYDDDTVVGGGWITAVS
jgi:tRNA-specific 2-thiouridylase